jgi:hypothetical protein
LILVLGLLAMFSLIGLSFLMMTSHTRQGAEAVARKDQQETEPEKLADEALLQVLRGSNNSLSVLQNHSLLEDVYGREKAVDERKLVIKDYLIIGGTPCEQIFEGKAQKYNTTTYVWEDVSLDDTAKLSGRSITFADGDLEGITSRIVGFRHDTSTGENLLQILTPKNMILVAGDEVECVVNSSPFTGTGFGFNTATTPVANDSPLLTATDPVTGGQRALLPNPVYFAPTTGSYEDLSGPGGANEDYDAADYQNMLMALQMPQIAFNAPQGQTPIPSLHRPSLVSWWLEERSDLIFSTPADQSTWSGATQAEKVEILDKLREKRTVDNPSTIATGLSEDGNLELLRVMRRIMLRPLTQDHPNFTGSNPIVDQNWLPFHYGHNATYDIDPSITGDESFFWDVDNDGDGVTDSIWVDLGFPVRSTKDGRMYKPLAAILCVDMDGRLNLNSHGSIAQAIETIDTQCDRTLGWGQGWGLADISLSPVVSEDIATIDYDNYRNILLERYGGLGYWLQGDNPAKFPEVKRNWFNRNFDMPSDPSDPNLIFDFDFSYTDLGKHNRAFGSYPDMFGIQSFQLDGRGQPMMTYANYSASGYDLSLENNPYLLECCKAITRGKSRFKMNETTDRLFGYGDLEAVLRVYDIDGSMIPNRLLELTKSTGQDSPLVKNRLEVTTESWSMPTQAGKYEITGTHNLSETEFKHPLELLNDLGVSETIQKELLPAEFLAGAKLNLNLPFGNGRDDDGDGIVDEPDEVYEFLPYLGEDKNEEKSDDWIAADGDMYDDGTTDAPNVHMDHDNDGITPDPGDTADTYYSRQLYARHLYVLAFLVMSDSSGTNLSAEECRAAAQWAVNVVDYRDRDSIMTPFEYDVNPIDGWGVDGDFINGGDIVWGCERPELLITETLAIHDRRTEDGAVGNTMLSGTPKDTDFDQIVEPEGSLFIELYNPNGETEALTSELYDSGAAGVDLKKLAPPHPTTLEEMPVWRMAIVEGAEMLKDPDDISNLPTIKREIYFIGSANGATFSSEIKDAVADLRFNPSSNIVAEIEPIMPGKYALIGPGEAADDTDLESETAIGYTLGQDLVDSSTRRIVLDMGSNDQVRVYSAANNNNDFRTPTISTGQAGSPKVEDAIPIIINEPNRLSVTEPGGGYSGSTPQNKPWDKLWGSGPGIYWTGADVQLKDNGCFNGVFKVHLQRLADPTRPYDKNNNPYRTIDSMPIDVTSYNSRSDVTDEDLVNNTTGIAPPDTLLDPEKDEVDIVTRQRGEVTPNNIYSQIIDATVDPTTNTRDGISRAVTDHGIIKDAALTQAEFHHTFGYLNAQFPFLDAANGNGDPADPFPWFPWQNRPLISSFELLQIPRTSSSQLLKLFLPASATGLSPYVVFSDPAAALTATPEQFAHLMSFMLGQDPGVVNYEDIWKLHRLFEYVEVPQRFSDSATYLDPAVFWQGTNHKFYPPYNCIPNLDRVPGKVNLNTIVSRNVWDGISGPNDATVPNEPVDELWTNFIESRRGYKPNAAEISQNYWYRINPTSEADAPKLPTRFTNPFRSFAGYYLVPDAEDQQGNTLQDAVGSEVGATMLREALDADKGPALRFNAPDFNTDANPYFRYLQLTRLGNLATTQSNVYAVWITLGYFEVEPVEPWEQHNNDTDADGNPIDALGLTQAEHAKVYPGGVTLGKEIGGDTGQIKRERSFYIIDRSIPVGFKRGKNLNVEDTILLKRRIE